MKLGMIVNSVQQEMEGTTITTDFTALSWHFLGGDRENDTKPQPFKNRNDFTLHIKTCHLVENNLQPFERPTGECCIVKQDMIIEH
jgi:hypothetical protein